MGNNNTHMYNSFRNIKLTLITKKNKHILKFSEFKNFSGENFIYFKVVKPFNERVFTLEIFKEEKNMLNTVQVYQIVINDFENFNKGEKKYYQYKADIDSNEIIFRYDDKFLLDEVVYKVNSRELIK